MKTVNRAQLRGKRLDPMCYKAKTARHEYGREDNRVFCYGVYDGQYDKPYPQCEACRAFVDHADPMGAPHGYVAVTSKRQKERLYYTGDADGHPCFGDAAAAVRFTDRQAAEREAARCAFYTGKDFQTEVRV